MSGVRKFLEILSEKFWVIGTLESIGVLKYL